MSRIALFLSFTACLFGASASAADRTQLTWYGQSAFRIETPAHHVLYIDPWFANAMNPAGAATGDAVETADLILVTHGHFDHVGQAAAIARRTGAQLVATLDLGEALKRYGGFPADRMSYSTLGNFGGVLTFFDGEVTITIVPAVHSSHVNAKDLGVGDDTEAHWGGSPSGFVVRVRNGPSIYHTGDTDLFADMALVNRGGPIDYLLVCIGDHFTMGPAKAADAVEVIRPKHVIPMHYGTFVPLMTGTPGQLRQELKQRRQHAELIELKVGVPRDL